jgi:O-antigen/teichoic acid export membrane protein
MQRTVSILTIALGITVIIVTTIAWLAPLAGEAVMAYVRQEPGGVFWVRMLIPVLPVVSFAAFGLAIAAQRRKVAKAGADAAR